MPRAHAPLALLTFVLSLGPAHMASAQTTIASRYLGAVNSASVRDMAWDASGNFYATGGVGVDFPAGATRLDRLHPSAPSVGVYGPHDVWIAKWSGAGVLQWTRLLGGPAYDRAYAIEVNGTGVYVAGRAGDGFPVTAGVLQETFAGDNGPNGAYGTQDGFVAKLDFDGAVQWATYFGDGSLSFIRDIAIDAQGHVYLAQSNVRVSNPHVTAGAYASGFPGGESAVVAKLALDGGSVLWASYLGGSQGQSLVNPSIRVDTEDRVYVTGYGDTTTFPTVQAAQPSQGGGLDIQLASLSADGATLRWSTYFGGSGDEGHETHSLAVGNGSVYLTGGAGSSGLGPTAGAHQTALGGAQDVFVARYDLDGSLEHVTYLGGMADDYGEGIDLAPNGSVVVTGATQSAGFPSDTNVWRGSTDDAYVAVLSADLSSLAFAALLGGSAEDRMRSVSVAADGTVAIGGISWSDDYPVDASSPPFVNDGSGGKFDQVDAVFTVFRHASTQPPPGSGSCSDGGLGADGGCDAGADSGDGADASDGGTGGSDAGNTGDGGLSAGTGGSSGGTTGAASGGDGASGADAGGDGAAGCGAAGEACSTGGTPASGGGGCVVAAVRPPRSAWGGWLVLALGVAWWVRRRAGHGRTRCSP